MASVEKPVLKYVEPQIGNERTYTLTKKYKDGKDVVITFVDTDGDGFDKNDTFKVSGGEFSVFTAKEVRNAVTHGIKGKRYDKKDERTYFDPKAMGLETVSNCKEIKQDTKYTLGSIMNCLPKPKPATPKAPAEAQPATERLVPDVKDENKPVDTGYVFETEPMQVHSNKTPAPQAETSAPEAPAVTPPASVPTPTASTTVMSAPAVIQQTPVPVAQAPATTPAPVAKATATPAPAVPAPAVAPAASKPAPAAPPAPAPAVPPPPAPALAVPPPPAPAPQAVRYAPQLYYTQAPIYSPGLNIGSMLLGALGGMGLMMAFGGLGGGLGFGFGFGGFDLFGGPSFGFRHPHHFDQFANAFTKYEYSGHGYHHDPHFGVYGSFHHEPPIALHGGGHYGSFGGFHNEFGSHHGSFGGGLGRRFC